MSKLSKFAAACVAAVGLVVAGAGSLNAAETAVDAIYVDCNATVGGDGSAGNPFRTIAEGIAAAGTDEKPTLVLVAEGTYAISATLSVTKAITVRGAGLDKTIVNGSAAVRGFTINHADAVVEELTVKNCKSSGSGLGVAFGANGGTLRNCRITGVENTAHSMKGGGVYLTGKALVTGCRIDGCNVSSTKSGTGVAAYLDGRDAVMEKTLVVNNRVDRNQGLNSQSGMVYVNKGTVRNCTIVGNRVYSAAGLSMADSADARAYDTISWGNEDWQDGSATAPNLTIGAKAVVSRLCAPVAAANDAEAITDDPLLDADYSMRPSSPCVERQVGAIPFDDTTPSFGLAATRRQGVDGLTATLSVVGMGGAAAAAVAWTVDGESVGSSLELEQSFGPGFHSVMATVTPAGGGASVEVMEEGFVKVYASEVFVDANSANPVAPYTTAQTAAKTFDDAYPLLATNGTMYIAAGTYTFVNEYHIRTPQRIVGADRARVILKPKSGGYRHFNLCNKDVRLSGVTLTGAVGGTSRRGSALYMTAGVVSNCVITGNMLASGNLHGGGVELNGANALITHSVISNNKITGGSGCCGMGVYMQNGTLDNCLVVTNTATATNKSGFSGGGIYMKGGKVINCTVAANSCGKGPGVYADGGGTIVNTIIFGNTMLGSGDVNWGGTTSGFINCCTLNAVGSGCVPVSDAPYQEDYTLAMGSPCIDSGDSSYVTAAGDFFGEERILGDRVDIGASEYRPSDAMSASITCQPLFALSGDEVTYTATVEGQGVDPEQCVYAWTIDGQTIAESGASFTNTLGVGLHAVGLNVICGGKSAAAETATVTVYPQDVYVATNAVTAFPYDSYANAFTNLNEAVETALPRMTIHIGEGRHRLGKTVLVDTALRLVGEGMYRTTVYRSGANNFRLFEMNATGSLLSDLAMTGGYGDGGGVYAHNNGGTVERCRIYGCSSGPNSDGGGVSLSGAASVIRHSILSNNTATISTGQLRGGGGAKLDYGAVCENCLIVGNYGQGGAGVLLGGNGLSRLSNCTLVGNHCNSNRTDYVGGAVYAQGGTVENCIVLGSYDNAGSVNPHVKGGGARYFNCFLPIDYGTKCVVGTDPGFRGATTGDCRIGARSPCAYAGRYGIWMDGATDFFGNPRTTPGKKVSIGCCQAPNPGLILIVR